MFSDIGEIFFIIQIDSRHIIKGVCGLHKTHQRAACKAMGSEPPLKIELYELCSSVLVRSVYLK
jgi:hypothetical protein